jgi:hypothetical protein
MHRASRNEVSSPEEEEVFIPWEQLSEEERQMTMLRSWDPLTVTIEVLDKMVAEGVLPSQGLIKWRPAEGEAVPMPQTGEVVVFTDFFESGFSFPPSPFLRGFRYHYGLELHHLNPNGVLRIASFATACEAFLGIHPHFALWKRLFLLKKLRGNQIVGAVGIQLRKEASSEFPSIALYSNLGSWRSNWFYAANTAPGLPEFTGRTPEFSADRWASLPADWEEGSAEILASRLGQAITAGLTGTNILRVFLSRRVQPLKQRDHPLFEYTGSSDSTRETPDLLSDVKLKARLKKLLEPRTSITLSGGPAPYYSAHPPDPVRL